MFDPLVAEWRGDHDFTKYSCPEANLAFGHLSTLLPERQQSDTIFHISHLHTSIFSSDVKNSCPVSSTLASLSIFWSKNSNIRNIRETFWGILKHFINRSGIRIFTEHNVPFVRSSKVTNGIGNHEWPLESHCNPEGRSPEGLQWSFRGHEWLPINHWSLLRTLQIPLF